MKSQTCTLLLLLWFGSPVAAAFGQPPDSLPELKNIAFRYISLKGLGYEQGVLRRDNSNVIRVGGLYYIYYARATSDWPWPSHAYNQAEIWYATSPDGLEWRERGIAVGRGGKGAYDEGAVFGPGVMFADGRYYLAYSAIPAVQSREHLQSLSYFLHMAVADSPDGPWRKNDTAIVDVAPGFAVEDLHEVADPRFIIRGGEYWLYFKLNRKRPPDATGARSTPLCLAIAQRPEGPYRLHPESPLIESGHEVCVWPHREGVAALITNRGKDRNTIFYAPDGIHFHLIAKAPCAPNAPGVYCPDNFTSSAFSRGVGWGISMVKHKDWPREGDYSPITDWCRFDNWRGENALVWPFLVRFEVDIRVRE